MPAVLRVAVDTAGGVIIGDLAPSVRVNGAHVVVVGAAVQSQGSGAHGNAHMVGHSSTVRAGGLAICRAGDAASCAHVGGAGSANVNAG